MDGRERDRQADSVIKQPLEVAESSALQLQLRRMLTAGELELPLPGGGATGDRLMKLCGIARSDLEVARLAEAHIDAIAILYEAGHCPQPHLLYGVWAAQDPSCRLELVDAPGADAAMALRGTKAFCTGSTLLDHALVSVRTREGVLLIDVDLHDRRVSFDESGWRTPAFSATATAVTTFDDVAVSPASIVGSPGFYLDRIGFAHGACGPAACWAGGALGLVDHAIAVVSRQNPNPHLDAYIGALSAQAWSLEALLHAAGQQIDQQPNDRATAMQRALMLRHRVERTATEVVDLHGRAVGPRSLIHDENIIRRIGQLQLYVRQHHDESDLEAIGAMCRINQS